MRVVTTPTPHGDTIFCDDIRNEADNKISIIGMYQGTMILNSPFPVTLAKFALLMSYTELPGESTSPVELRVTVPGEDKPRLVMPVPMEKVRSEAPDHRLENPRITVRSAAVFGGFQLKQEGHIRVRAYRDDLEIKMGSLLVINKTPLSPQP